MPSPAHAPSLVIASASLLTEQDRTDVTLALEPTEPEVSLDGGSHVARVLSASMTKLAEQARGESAALHAEIDRLDRVQALLPAASPVPEALAAGKLTLWTVARRIDAETADPRLLLRLGALYYASRVSFARPSQVALRAAIEAVEAAGTPRASVALTVLEQVTNAVLAKATTKLNPRASSHRSAASSAAEQRIEQRWIGARSFTNQQKISGLGDTLTAAEVIATAGHVRRTAEAGDMLAHVVALAHWMGIWLWEFMQVALWGVPGTGLIRVAADCTHARVNLSGAFWDFAAPRGERSKPSTLEVVIVFPRWIAEWLRALRSIHPDANTLQLLTGLRLPRGQWRVPGMSAAHDRRLTVHRFIDGRSAPLIGKADQHVMAVTLLDLKRAEKSAYPYPALTIQEVLAVQEMRAQLIGWGPLCEYVPPTQNAHVGSRNTPLREATLELVEARRRGIQAARHGPNAGWDLLVAHHNQFVRYVLVLCTLAWMLRGRLAHSLPASLIRLYMAIGFRDKAVPEAQCAPAPLVCGSVLRQQFDHLHSHTAALADRLEKRSGSHPERTALVENLRRVARGEDGVDLLQLIEGTTLRSAGAHDLGAELPLDWRFSGDALRHFGSDAYRENGTPAEMIELLLRHAGNGFELFSTSCGVSLREWADDAGDAQDRMLLSLGVTACAGLVATLARVRP